MTVLDARRGVVRAGNRWRLAIVAVAQTDTERTKAELTTARERLDSAIAELFDTVYEDEMRTRKGTKR